MKFSRESSIGISLTGVYIVKFDNKKWRSPSSFLSYKRLKLKLRVFLAGHNVAMVTYCTTKLTATSSPMIGQFVDTMILASTGIEWLQ